MKTFMAIYLIMAALSVGAYDLWFTWTASPAADVVSNYVIEQAKLPNTNFVAVVTVSGLTNVGVVKGLATSSKYQFRIVAKNMAGASLPSNVVTFPTNAPSQISDFQLTTPK